MYNYGLIGNCQISALVHQSGSLDWLCMPRPDSPPIFGRILDTNGGHFSIFPPQIQECRQNYIPNTNVLVTTIDSHDGSQFEIVDFCPRFYQYGRIYRPISLYRVVRPLRGTPKVQVSCRPISDWQKVIEKPLRGNSHLRFELKENYLRLITNMPLTYLCEEKFFALTEPLYFGLTWGYGIEDDLTRVVNTALDSTIDYWKTWVKHCSIPSLYQSETIRSALTLKLHCYEDTGAILAALTTSLPEEPGQTRNWDYRFCWLRDAAFVLSAFHSLGHFEEMEGFIKFLLNIAKNQEHSKERLRPVYTLDQGLPLPELEHPGWTGFENSRPVRSGNQAAEHVQNDVYGEMVLTLAPIFFDDRFHHLRSREHEELLEHLGRLCAKNISVPDAGLWELRNGWQEHSFSNLMCWAGLDRIQKIQQSGFLKNLDLNLEQETQRAKLAVQAAVRDGVLRNSPQDDSYDAALLELPLLRFPDPELCFNTVDAIATKLSIEGNPSFLYRYLRKDDFGHPQSAFVICSFWLVQALAQVGRREDALKVMKEAIKSSNSLGLIAEHFLPATRKQTGNFPQAYSHVGQINAAFAISPPWRDVI